MLRDLSFFGVTTRKTIKRAQCILTHGIIRTWPRQCRLTVILALFSEEAESRSNYCRSLFSCFFQLDTMVRYQKHCLIKHVLFLFTFITSVWLRVSSDALTNQALWPYFKRLSVLKAMGRHDEQS